MILRCVRLSVCQVEAEPFNKKLHDHKKKIRFSHKAASLLSTIPCVYNLPTLLSLSALLWRVPALVAASVDSQNKTGIKFERRDEHTHKLQCSFQ